MNKVDQSRCLRAEHLCTIDCCVISSFAQLKKLNDASSTARNLSRALARSLVWHGVQPRLTTILTCQTPETPEIGLQTANTFANSFCP